ncbi:MAG: heavy-metal-associated domain-containing protein [Symploca sp. SIO2G7]|nr:heavy-metal-associated domain-containing protein [Symploca sp. SIO2G7]
MTLQLTVPNMVCDVCAKNITNAIKALDTKAMVTADPKTKRVDIATAAAEAAIREALERAGYPASV